MQTPIWRSNSEKAGGTSICASMFLYSYFTMSARAK